MSIPKQFAADVQRITNKFLPEAIGLLQARLKDRKLVVTEELLKSVSGKLTHNLNEASAELVLEFQMSGRFKDMKKINYTSNAPPVDVMESYVKKIGVGKYKYIPGYTYAGVQRMPTADVAAKRIAWGLSQSYIRGKKVKSNRWFSKYFYGPVVGALVEELIAATGTSSLQILDEL